MSTSTSKAAFFHDVVSISKAQQQQKKCRALAGTCDLEQTLTKLQPTDVTYFSSRSLEFGSSLVIDGDWMVAGANQNSTSPPTKPSGSTSGTDRIGSFIKRSSFPWVTTGLGLGAMSPYKW